MDTIKQIFYSYTHILDILPEDVRVLTAVIILIILLILFLRFVQKSIGWMVLFILLLPAAWPAVREIGVYLYEKIVIPLMK